MRLSRRRLLVSATGIAAAQPMLVAARQQVVTSGAIGLTVADMQSIYEELPPGQSFLNFADPLTGATLYVDFGDDDFARNVWVDGEIDESTALDLLIWLCPDDIVLNNQFEIFTGAGSLASRKSILLSSTWLGEIDEARSLILASYVVSPGTESVEELMLSLEIGGRG